MLVDKAKPLSSSGGTDPSGARGGGRWRVEGSLFDDEDDDRAADFTGVVGRDPANNPTKR